MNKYFFNTTFAVGALALLWVAAGFFGSHGLALAVTLLVAAFYGLGAWELLQFRRATTGLTTALQSVPDSPDALGAWLGTLHPSLRNPVRLRIEGERIGLPGPALTPYLVGLLVMLGMLGTFLGMVVTLNGAVFALEGTTDLQAIRAAFAAPIKGLGLAFGTSVAGVAASAMLGLMSALSRHERALASQHLDTLIATRLRSFSHAHQRQQTLETLALQSQALPQVVDQLHALMQQMDRTNQHLSERLLSNQTHFHSHIQGVYTELAQAVDTSLRNSLAEVAQTAAASMAPVVDAALHGMAQESRAVHTRMVEDIAASVQTLAGHAQAQQHAALAEIARLITASEALVDARIAAEAQWTQQHSARMEQLTMQVRTELGALRDAEALRGQAAVAQLGELQTVVAQHLTTLGTALEAPITRLIHTASEAPRAAAEVIGKLRQEVSNSTARDNALLEERSRILDTLNGLLASIHHASGEQRGVIDTLVEKSALALQTAGTQFAQTLDAQTDKLTDLGASITSSAVDVSALGETLGFAVGAFSGANDKLIANLQRIEAAMDKSMARSDDQLAYYVAQAREVIDLSILSQKEMVEALRHLRGKQPALADAAA